MAASSRRLVRLCSQFISANNTKCRLLHVAPQLLAAQDAEFAKAKDALNVLKEDPGNMVKLELYALFKQATVGKCNIPKPGMMDFVGKAKWEAWNNLGDITQDEAQLKYIDVVKSLMTAEGVSSSSSSESSSNSESGKYKELLFTVENGYSKIVLNRPTKKNAINYQMYDEWIQALKEAGENDSAFAVVTGAGDYYCSGNDLSNFANIPPDGIAAMAKTAREILKKFVNAFIDFPKPLIAVVNGPAVGVSVTTLGLFDVVYATDKATFNTPFSALGQSPEGCSSYVFPKIMGFAKANEVLLFNRKMTAQEACDRGLVSEVFPDSFFQKEVWSRIEKMAKLPKTSLHGSKKLIRDVDRETLYKVNEEECILLERLWQSEECAQAIMSFFTKK